MQLFSFSSYSKNYIALQSKLGFSGTLSTFSFLWHENSVASTTEENSYHLLSVTTSKGTWHMGSKTLLQQNPTLFNWLCL